MTIWTQGYGILYNVWPSIRELQYVVNLKIRLPTFKSKWS